MAAARQIPTVSNFANIFTSLNRILSVCNLTNYYL
ncbi:hypothetical protein SAMN05444172_3153 [Burkholderia sp. GAS332]|nr:hypothetical protein SAMN05444172_3153 [Burkholderia sp. GAS332]